MQLHRRLVSRLKDSASNPQWVIVILVLGVWLPFATTNRPLAEEWMYLEQFDRGAGILYSFPDHILRPFLASFYYIPYWFSANHLIYFNIFLLALMLAKGLLAYHILNELTHNNKPIALLGAALFIIFPADLGLFNLRALGLHGVLALYLLAVLLILRISNQQPIRVATLILLWMAQAYCLGAYEGYYALILSTPFLLGWLSKDFGRQFIKLSLIWYFIPLVMIVFHISQLATAHSLYQTGVLSIPTRFAQDISAAFIRAYFINFVAGWYRAITRVTLSNWSYMAAAVAGITGFLLYRALNQSSFQMRSRSLFNSTKLTLFGLAFVGIAYAPYVITNYREDLWRVFYATSFGATIVIAVGIYLLSQLFGKRAKTVFVLLSTIGIGFAVVNAYEQQSHNVAILAQEQAFISDIVRQTPEFADSTVLLVLNSPPWLDTFNSPLIFHHGIFESMLRYLYQDEKIKNVVICDEIYMNQMEAYSDMACRLTGSSLVVSESWYKTKAIFPWSEIVAYTYSDEQGYEIIDHIPTEYMTGGGSAYDYQPESHIIAEAPIPERVVSFLEPEFLARATHP